MDRVKGTPAEQAVLRRALAEGAEAFTMELPGGYRTTDVKVDLVKGHKVVIQGHIKLGASEAGYFEREVRFAHPHEGAFGDEVPGYFKPGRVCGAGGLPRRGRMEPGYRGPGRPLRAERGLRPCGTTRSASM
jgi:hypothetical protein